MGLPCSYLVEELSWFDFGEEREIDNSHLSCYFFRIKIKDGQKRGEVRRNLKEQFTMRYWPSLENLSS